MAHSPTPEQQAAIEAARVDSRSLMLSAFAGCAKSSTLEMLSPGIREPALALAFNKRIAQEIAERLPSNFQTRTLNSLGFRAWMSRANMPRAKLDDRKIGSLVTEISKDSKSRLSTEQWQWIRATTSKAIQEGLLPRAFEAREGATPLAPSSDLPSLAVDVGCPQGDLDLVCDLAEQVLTRDIELGLIGTLCFDDQIYLPVTLGAPWPKFPCIVGDEVQDWSSINHAMVERCLRRGGRIVGAGDQLQAIYGWRGADYDSMESLRALAPSWLDLPLTMTFRCPKAVVARQQGHARGFRAFEGNAQGRVEDWTQGVGGWSMTRVIEIAQGRPIAILCRNNAPLMSLAFKLIRRRIGVQMLGRDIGKGLEALSSKISKDDSTSAQVFRSKLREWAEQETSLALANGREALADSIADRAECLEAVLDSGAANAGQLRQLLKELFSRDSGQILLSSIHRSKGLEWPLVLHLDPWRIPSKQASRAASRGDDRALRQEWNLRYVCETRTQETLILANVEGFTS